MTLRRGQQPGLVYTSPHSFKPKQRLTLTAAPPLIAGTLKALERTCRHETRGAEHLEAALAMGNGHIILAFWHEVLGLAAWHFRGSGAHTLTSYSFDGELAARIIHHFGQHALRGSSSRGGARALKELEKACACVEIVGFTLDGPRGPRRVAKPGVGILAARTGVPILPLAFAASRAWRMRSWDRLIVPKPFARVVTAFAPPIEPHDANSPEGIEELRVRAEGDLNDLHLAIEDEMGVRGDTELEEPDATQPGGGEEAG